MKISLRSFLLIVLIVGALSGLFGPAVVRMLKEWSPPPTAQPQHWHEPTTSGGDSVYYESGETPLD